MTNILGPYSGDDWGFSLFLFFLGFVLLKLVTFVKNTKTGKFSMIFWLRDNFREFIAGLIIYYICFRFHKLTSIELLKFWDTVLLSNKFLFTFIISVSMNLILVKLRSKLNLTTSSISK